MLDLPTEMLHRVIMFASTEQVMRFSETCKRFYHVAIHYMFEVGLASEHEITF
jgi:hypothetical protein